ncbi:TOM20_plant domain-containing protein [Cucumis melo var. makuwa]|uniref:TOM20_plant domain-containing protein n=2 Tax=Cucumis melo TaxID=3656 RepID=A0A5D3CLY3_CUCMM|nr:hypothetical protein [Cucumis melo subsp. melo]KAA0052970.1 TOM20_plant domain-containing protein [Cucumis melo var. makuwa]TYK11426.1 TOM20_plant domain-containing protein [Cucumis melo var. makuwa]
MSPTPEEPNNLQNGIEIQPHISSESDQISEPRSELEEPTADSIPSSELQQERESESVSNGVADSEPESPRKQLSESIHLHVVTGVTDPSVEEHKETSTPFNGNTENLQPALRKDEGSRTFTMRELLNGLKGEDGSDGLNESEGERPEGNSGHRFGILLGFVLFCCLVDVLNMVDW